MRHARLEMSTDFQRRREGETSSAQKMRKTSQKRKSFSLDLTDRWKPTWRRRTLQVGEGICKGKELTLAGAGVEGRASWGLMKFPSACHARKLPFYLGVHKKVPKIGFSFAFVFYIKVAEIIQRIS